MFRMPPGYEDRASHEAFTFWAGIAESTSRIELGAMVLCTAFRNPAVMAKEAVSLDAIAGHRIILGVGCGWHEPEFKAFGIPFTPRVSMFEEAMSIIHPLLRTGEVSFSGTHYRAEDCVLVPPDDRPGGIPILIASKQPRMMELTARFADQWNTAWWGDVDGYLHMAAKLDVACEKIGRDPATLVRTAGVTIEFADAVPPADSYDPGRLVKGPIEHVAEKLQAYAETGCAHVICFLNGLTPQKTAMLAEASRMAGLTKPV
jgi:alkanesulfonate monooxygenase SsuD/methylene tetrahydromethanopterin reductase-like flavin-dependent oxidoreductase (luciferase family)